MIAAPLTSIASIGKARAEPKIEDQTAAFIAGSTEQSFDSDPSKVRTLPPLPP